MAISPEFTRMIALANTHPNIRWRWAPDGDALIITSKALLADGYLVDVDDTVRTYQELRDLLGY